jgi:hypothetical protein
VAASSASPMFLSFDWKKSRCGSSNPTAPAMQSVSGSGPFGGVTPWGPAQMVRGLDRF